MATRAPRGEYPVALSVLLPRTVSCRHVRARATGEYRPPRRGEWYLSGAIVGAYRAPNDLTMPFWIATLVEPVATVTEWREVTL